MIRAMSTHQHAEQADAAPQRNTRQRSMVRAQLADVDEFLTAQQIFARLRDEQTRIGLATVYRNLQLLADSGEVDVIRNPDGEQAFKLCSTGHHHHLICRSCGKVVEIASDEIEQWINQIAAKNGYRDPDHDIEIYALCPDC